MSGKQEKDYKKFICSCCSQYRYCFALSRTNRISNRYKKDCRNNNFKNWDRTNDRKIPGNTIKELERYYWNLYD